MKAVEERANELEKLESLAESFGELGDFTHLMRESYTRLESKFEDLNSRLARVNVRLRQSLAERNRLANYLNSILESLNSAVIVTDQDGIINVFNFMAEEYTGISASAALGSDYFRVLGNAATKQAEQILSGQKTAVSGEKEIRLSDGAMMPVAYSITTLRRFGDESMAGMVEILHDLSETRKLERNLKRVSTLAALGEMAATVAHEIRNPIAGISGFTSLLLRDMKPGDDSRKLVEKIAGGVTSLEAIVGNLLDFTRDVSPDIREVDLHALVQEAISEYKTSNSLDRHSIAVECGSRKMLAELDPVLFRQVVYNLVRNAVQAQPDGGRVRVKISRGGGPVLILTVEDWGQGISDGNLDRLFTPFFTTKTSGTGLGLATVKKLVELHGGKVMATNREGGGAAFTVEVPCGKGDYDEA